MRFAISSLSLLALASAAPTIQQRDTCLNDTAASRVADNFASLIRAYTVANANHYLTSDFHDYSDSVITLIDSGCPSGAPAGSPLPFVPLGSPTFDSLAAFEAGQGSQPNVTTFKILNVWHGCKAVTLRWRATQPNPYQGAPGSLPDAPPIDAQEQVTGIIVLETISSNGEGGATEPYLIQTVYSEFNSGAWLYDLGVFKPANCSSS